MDWLHIVRSVALAAGLIAGIVAIMATLVIGAMVWLLNHPKD